MFSIDDFLDRGRRADELSRLKKGMAIARRVALPGAQALAMNAYRQRPSENDGVRLAEVLLDLYSYEQAAHILRDLHADNCLPRVVAAAHVPRVWQNQEHPSSVLIRDEWLALFAMAGYTHNFETAVRPNEAMTLYRGATYECRYGLSWSEKKTVAGSFGRDHIWRGHFEPDRLLARITNASSGLELEYVADPTGLTLTDVQRD